MDTDWIQVHLRSVCIQELVHRCVVLIQVHFGSVWTVDTGTRTWVCGLDTGKVGYSLDTGTFGECLDTGPRKGCVFWM